MYQTIKQDDKLNINVGWDVTHSKPKQSLLNDISLSQRPKWIYCSKIPEAHYIQEPNKILKCSDKHKGCINCDTYGA